ncbi:hypothetical protein GCM10022408_36000 [Hymenobacter fastidiosus]|uniref:Damage-inducible protein DinB n=1 Tax=Hymenobacter fastidiosus TaxID=486264 RepID=A0ABP7T057_9BACT
MINTIEKLGAYNVWANDTLLQHFDGLEAGGAPIPANVLRLFSHVLNAQSIWIGRLTNTPSPVKVWQEHDLAGLRYWHEQSTGRVYRMAIEADENELHRLISYTNSVGEAFTSQVSDIFTHLPIHANYHRGQVAIQLREQGLEPVNTDYITYCRELSAAGQEAVSL